MTAGSPARSAVAGFVEPTYRDSARCLLRLERDGTARIVSASPPLAQLLAKKLEDMIGQPGAPLFGMRDALLAELIRACRAHDHAIEVDLDCKRLLLMPGPAADEVLAVFIGRVETLRAAEELERKNAALLRLTEELRRARVAADDSNRAKSRFLAHMSHELRTPLNGVIGFADIMRAGLFGPVEPERYREYVELIHNSGALLLSLINDILDMSKIEAGKMELTVAPLETATLAEACRIMVVGMARDSSVAVKVAVDPDCPEVHADERAAKQMIINLMSNAVKFTPPGGVVTLCFANLGPHGVAITVEDNGIGMTPAELARAMLPFGQVDSELARQHKGTGIGLTLVKSLAELHGGTLAIVSAKGHGTTATITLPWMKA